MGGIDRRVFGLGALAASSGVQGAGAARIEKAQSIEPSALDKAVDELVRNLRDNVLSRVQKASAELKTEEDIFEEYFHTYSGARHMTNTVELQTRSLVEALRVLRNRRDIEQEIVTIVDDALDLHSELSASMRSSTWSDVETATEEDA